MLHGVVEVQNCLQATVSVVIRSMKARRRTTNGVEKVFMLMTPRIGSHSATMTTFHSRS